MKILIYGIGSGRLRVEQYLKDEHEIIGYSDSFFNEEFFNGKKFYKPKEILETKFDCIILSIGEETACKEIINNLVKDGIQSDKIINFYKVYLKRYRDKLPLKRTDKIMQYTNKNYEGIILGLSHSANGINPDYLSKNFCNIAIPSQDLYYNFKQLEYISKDYPERIENLNYAIIDMYKYVYFNYDVSLSKSAIEYYSYSGFRDDEKHNYKKKINEELKKNEIRIITEPFEEDLFDKLFSTGKININEDYKKIKFINEYLDKKYRDKSLDDQIIEEYRKKEVRLSSIQKKIFHSTEEENIEIFRKILEMLKNINKKIKIYIVLIPQFKLLEDREKIIESKWKYRFYDVIDKFKEDYKLRILDFKDYEKLSSEKKYYFDLQHLNYNGAITFTKLLDSFVEY